MRYLEASIHSASPEELIIKVYDALLLFARQAIDVMETRPADIQSRHDLLRRAQRACALLMGSLKLDLDSEIPGNLFRIYEFWHHQLVAANMQGDSAKVRELLPLLLAVSANSPFLDRRDTGLASVRSETFTRTFPRCGVSSPPRSRSSVVLPDPFGPRMPTRPPRSMTAPTSVRTGCDGS